MFPWLICENTSAYQVASTQRKRDIVIAEIETEQIDSSTIGLIVDGVDEIRSVRQDMIEDSTPVAATVSDEFLRGILKLEDRLVILLDINRAF